MLIWWCEPTQLGNTRIRVKNLKTGTELSRFIHWLEVYKFKQMPVLLETVIREMEKQIEG